MKKLFHVQKQKTLQTRGKNVFFAFLFFLCFITPGNAQLKIGSTGNIGIGGLQPSASYNLIGGSARFSNIGVGVDPNINYSLRCSTSYINYLGVNIPPNTSFRLLINGALKIDNGNYPGLIFDNTYYAKGLYPTVDNKCQLGLSSNSFQYVYTYSLITTSDKRKKENITNITNSLDLLLKIQGVKYDLKNDNTYPDSLLGKNSRFKEKVEKERKGKIGFIAQDLLSVIPEVVVYDDSTDIYGINYIEIIPYLVEAIKEQQKEIEELKKRSGIKLKNASDFAEINSVNVAWLGKCKPNPFNEEATIEYFIPSEISRATFYIYDLQGKQMKSIAISNPGEGAVKIYANELQPGMYQYVLVADGNIIGNETMIVTE